MLKGNEGGGAKSNAAEAGLKRFFKDFFYRRGHAASEILSVMNGQVCVLLL